jgi:1,4-dihydroxy-2-naphthoate octaprenyltransferase
MNFSMWHKALTVIPSVSKLEWDDLDIVSRWLISTRAAVLAMTLTSALLAGLFAWRDNSFNFLPWSALAFGLIMAHASNNLLNDYVDHSRGVDQNNYYRTMYGPHPLTDQLMSKRQHLTYFAVSGTLALVSGVALAWYAGFSAVSWLLLGSGAFILLFYTWPLKYIALGEVAVLLVWGPLMIGGGYYVITRVWDWNVAIASLVYALSVTTVIFGKHIDKLEVDRQKNIHTLPSLLGEKTSRMAVLGMMLFSFGLIVYLVVTRYFTPVVLITVLALPRFRQILPAFLQPKPAVRPENFPNGQGGWPLYFAPLAFWYTRTFGSFFFLGLLADVILKKFLI